MAVAEQAAELCGQTEGCTGFDNARCQNAILRENCDTFLHFHDPDE